MSIEKITVLEPSLTVFVTRIVELVLEGYEIDPEGTPAMFGYQYEAIMQKDTEKAVDPVAEPEKRKPGRPVQKKT